MRKLLKAVGIAFFSGCVLSGCAGFGGATPLPVSQSLSPAAQSVQTAINEAQVTLTASYNVLAQNTADGIYTKAQAQSYKASLDGYSKRVDAAQDLLRGGDILNAQNQAQAVNALITALHKQIAEKARQ